MSHPTYAPMPPDDESTDEERIEKLATMTVAAAKGIVPAGQVILPLMQIAGSPLAPPEVRSLCRVLLQIVRGDRNPARGRERPAKRLRRPTPTCRSGIGSYTSTMAWGASWAWSGG